MLEVDRIRSRLIKVIELLSLIQSPTLKSNIWDCVAKPLLREEPLAGLLTTFVLLLFKIISLLLTLYLLVLLEVDHLPVYLLTLLTRTVNST